MKHVDIAYLWLQRAVRDRVLSIHAVSTDTPENIVLDVFAFFAKPSLLRALVLAVLSSVSDACPMDLTGRGRYTWMLFTSSAAFDPEPNTCTADVVVNQSDVIFTWNNCIIFMWISICTVPVISVLVMILRQQAEQLQNLVDIKKTIVHFTIGEGMARESTMETLNNLVAERIRGLHGGGGEEHPEDSGSSWEPQTLEEFIQYYGSEPEEMLGRSDSLDRICAKFI